MSLAPTITVTAPPPASSGVPARRFAIVGKATLAVAVFLGGFVWFEPAPYELFLAGVLAIWFLLGLPLPRSILPMVIFLVLFNVGGALSTSQLADVGDGLHYVAVSFFLAMTSVFFAAAICDDMGRLRTIFRAYTAAALFTACLGIAGYFNAIPGTEIFTRYSRAAGGFEDPNVFAPFLVAPLLYLIYGVFNRSAVLAPARIAAIAILMLAILLAFSRAGWGLAVVAVAMQWVVLVINERRPAARVKYFLLAMLGAAAAVVMIIVALQFEAVSSLFNERAQLVQTYDAGQSGRFGRHLIGLDLALTHPLGLGPLAFGQLAGGDTHNNWVKALMAYGWLGFVAYNGLIIWTIAAGFKLLFAARPWQPYLQIAYVMFIGHIMISLVIDTDHWRHFYLMIGIIWGCVALETRWRRHAARSAQAFGG